MSRSIALFSFVSNSLVAYIHLREASYHQPLFCSTFDQSFNYPTSEPINSQTGFLILSFLVTMTFKCGVSITSEGGAFEILGHTGPRPDQTSVKLPDSAEMRISVAFFIWGISLKMIGKISPLLAPPKSFPQSMSRQLWGGKKGTPTSFFKQKRDKQASTP